LRTYAYIKLSTGEYPFFQGDVRLEHPEIGDVFVCPETYAEVCDTEIIPVRGENENLVEDPPIKINGIWTRQFKTVAFTPPKQFDPIMKPASQRETKIFATATTGRIPVHVID
jgi:hypothetical protein